LQVSWTDSAVENMLRPFLFGQQHEVSDFMLSHSRMGL